MPENSIQNNLFEYFKDNDTFTLKEANEAVLHHYNRDVKIPSIRARIYEGIDKGLFKRVGKGVYTVVKNDSTCMVINGDGRDLSFIATGSIDTIITDHPYSLKKSQTGGNRSIGKTYKDDMFQYNEKDMKEKKRVLKPGGFLVEMLPERNADNFEYLNRIVNMAQDVGLEFYAVVPWKKGDFVINQGRKSKNTEDIYFFTNGKARSLRPDVKKDKQYALTHEDVVFKQSLPGSNTINYSDMGNIGSSYETSVNPIEVDIKISVKKDEVRLTKDILKEAWYNAVQYDFENSPLDIDNGGYFTYSELCSIPVQEYILKYLEQKGISYIDVSNGPVYHFMSGSKGMLPTVFDIQPPDKKNKIHEHEKPVELYEKILEYTTLPGEKALDQFAGAGGLGKAALNLGRDSILIEINDIACQKLVVSLEPYGSVQTVGEQVLRQLKESEKFDLRENIPISTVNKKKPSIESQITEAKIKSSEQISFFEDEKHNRWDIPR